MKFPDNVVLKYIPAKGSEEACSLPTPLKLSDIVHGGENVLIVSVPGAFTPTCSETHLPPYLLHAAEIFAKGISKIIVLSANDPFVMAAWKKSLKVENPNIIFASDPNVSFCTQGLSVDSSSNGMGIRCARFAMVVKNGDITYLGRESAPGVSVSGYRSVKL